MSAERDGSVTETEPAGASFDDVFDGAFHDGAFHDGGTVTLGMGDRFLDPDGLANPMMRSACGYVSWLDVPVDDGDDA